MKNKKGITLISLIITIIVMLILAGVALAFSVGEEGIMTQAENAKKTQANKEEEERVSLAVLNAKTSKLSSNGEIEFNETLIKEAVEKEFGAGSCEVREETDCYVVTMLNSNNEYKIDKLENGNTPEGEDLGEYYLRLINVAYEFVEASRDEINKAQEEMWELMDSGREFELINDTDMEICYIIDNYYYYMSFDNFELKLLDKNSNEFKKYNAILNELKDVEEKLNTLLSGNYTYTEATWSEEEFKKYIKDKIGKTVRNIENDKEIKVDSLEIISSIDEKTLLLYYMETSNQESTYKIESVKNGNQGGF